MNLISFIGKKDMKDTRQKQPSQTQLTTKKKFELLRQQIEQNIQAKQSVANLVREYVRQRPEVTIQIIQKWIGS